MNRYMSPHAVPSRPAPSSASSASSFTSAAAPAAAAAAIVTDEAVTDVTAVITAVLLLALKARGAFKPRLLRRLVESAYCQVYPSPTAPLPRRAP